MEDIYDKIKLYEVAIANRDSGKIAFPLSELLSEDFSEVGSSGRLYSKSDYIDSLNRNSGATIVLSKFNFTKLSEASVLVRYSSYFEGKHAYRSSIWVCNNNQWQLLYHQGTVAY